MLKPRLNVGLIGCGWLGQEVHLRLLKQMPEVELIALAEPDMQRRVEISRSLPKAAALQNYRDLLTMAEVEAVIICVPPALHAEVAVAALEHGKHVYLEKPIATSLVEAQRVVTAWRNTGLVGMIGFNYRFNVLYQAARQQIQAGRLGVPLGVRSVFSIPRRSLPAWKETRSSGGGVLLELASHHVDLVRFFFKQEVDTVFAELRSQRSEHDNAGVQLQLTEGLLIQSFFSFSAIDEDRFEIYGQAGKLMVDRYRSLDVEFTEPGTEFSLRSRIARRLQSFANIQYPFKKLFAPWNEPSYREALSRFVMAVRGEGAATPDLLDGYRSLEVICAAERSAQTGQSVSLLSSLNAL